jgi:catechol 2,3-dioxygenase-like lactoylglutathione lyase family enzyme
VIAEGEVMGFVPTADSARARSFYEKALGLGFVSEDQFALVVKSGETFIRIAKVAEFEPAPYTILGWRVQNIEDEVRTLNARGVAFKRYSYFAQDDLGIWAAPSGDKVAWFNDPDGNVLSLSQHVNTT